MAIIDDCALTPAELLMHRLHQGAGGAMNVSGFARVAGSLSQVQVANAVAALQQRHPALRVVVVDRGRSAAFAAPEAPAPIPVEWQQTPDPDAWIATALTAGRRPFDVREGPLARVAVLAHPSGDWSDLVLTAHHMITDGRSHVTMLRELALLCAGGHLAASPSRVRPVPQVVAPRGVVRPLLRAGAHQLRLWPQLRRSPLAEIRPDEMPLDADVIARRVRSEEATARLRERAREERTTVYGALAAALILSLCELHDLGDRSVRIRSPIDIRDRCQPPVSADAVGCYAGMAEYVILAPLRLAFWDLARQCRAEIDLVLDTGLPAAGWKLLGALLARGRRIPVRSALCNVNNQGVIDEPEGSLLPILELGATANLQGVSDTVMLYSATVQGRLNLTLRSPWHSAEDLDRLFGAVLRRLDEHGA